MLALPSPGKTMFDSVIADSVLEHVCDPQHRVAEYIGVLSGPVYAAMPLFREQCLADRHHLQSVLRLIELSITYPLRHLDPLFPHCAIPQQRLRLL